MTKQEIMKAARAKRDSDRLTLKGKDLSLQDYIAERQRISDEYGAIREANKPTHNRLSSWQKADNVAFQRWGERQS